MATRNRRMVPWKKEYARVRRVNGRFKVLRWRGKSTRIYPEAEGWYRLEGDEFLDHVAGPFVTKQLAMRREAPTNEEAEQVMEAEEAYYEDEADLG